MKPKNILNTEDKIYLYRIMKKIRLFDKAFYQLTTQGFIFGSTHFYIGQEAIAAGICFFLNRKDYIISTHRCSGHLIAKGADLKKIMAELMARKTGYCGGKGGSMHLMAPEVGMMGANGIVGAGIPISVGLGYACKNFEQDRIVASFFGDGAINTGAFHESLNLASAWELPVLFICENNQYAISTEIKKSINIKDLSLRAKSYGIPGFRIDGNDVIKVLNQAKTSIDIIKKKKTPVLLVCDTYRQMGHSINDPKTYRTKKEEDFWLERDPVKKMESLLLAENILDKSALSEIEKQIQLEIDDAIEFAKNSPKPDLTSLYNNVFAGS